MTELEAWAAVRPLAWDDSSRAVLHDALARATPRPWPVDLGDQEVVFREPPGGQDPGNAALYRCGAALAAAWTVLRVLGHDLVAEIPAEPGPLAVLRVVGRSSPAGRDWRRYAAIRDLAAPGAVVTPAPPAALQAIVDDSAWPETQLVIVDPGAASRTGLVIDGAPPEPVILDGSARPETGPATVRPQWPFTLGSGGSAVLALTDGSARRHRVLAGAVVHRARLSAAAAGFGTEVIAGPRPRAVAEAAALPGFPHALLRFGTAG
ncbi:hypothetical protein [Amycolatopsis saalfeldensis]|uniref:Uncharacterized protein n=1 Tax=Amycolatopsis saalfeldensis TaxID=394193 RepID=A0A1H8UW37_9PSEU|nr:hypothetical protein [Amycolatopsis saalfeldensis]SEP07430.1 hypothetical protein SAMN04489732_103500 [Amycolatopsis saalfeldensis]